MDFADKGHFGGLEVTKLHKYINTPLNKYLNVSVV